MTFKDLKIIPEILQELTRIDYEEPTPIQSEAIPAIMAGRDVLASAQTGTGKTAAFAIPTLQLLNVETYTETPTAPQTSKIEVGKHQARPRQPRGKAAKPKAKSGKHTIRALVLTPTRELALQIYENYRIYGKALPLRTAVIFGGVSQRQQEIDLAKNVDILIATPGRLLDLIGQKLIDIGHIDILILDEADRMLDMGFIHDVRRILRYTPEKKQTLFFSATLPRQVTDLASSLVQDPVRITIAPEVTTVEAIEQSVYYVDKINKRNLLRDLLTEMDVESALVFTRTKHGADRVVRDLTRNGIQAIAIHGNKSQNARVRALNAFKKRQVRVLVATDIAARGLDIDDLSHVINFDLPDVPESYVHRIGRTGRAGKGGIAISFCDIDERAQLSDIQRFIGQRIPVVDEHRWKSLIAPLEQATSAKTETPPAKVSKLRNGGRRLPGQRRRR